MTSPTPPSQRRRPLLRAVSAGVAAVLVAVSCGDDEPSDGTPGLEEAAEVSDVDHDYVIPAGTGERLDAGEDVTIVPLVLEAEVGETIRIVNEDERGHLVGVFFVGAGETLTQTFTSPGEFTGSCTVHTDGEFTLRVSA